MSGCNHRPARDADADADDPERLRVFGSGMSVDRELACGPGWVKLSRVNSKARWNALAHRMIGDTAALEGRIDVVLALADARDRSAFFRLLRVYPRLSITERVDLLATLEHPGDDTPQNVARWLKTLIRMRNRLAHAWVVKATDEKAIFSSIYRGARHDLVVFDVEMARAFQMIRESERSLQFLADQVGDAELWGQLMGFDER